VICNTNITWVLFLDKIDRETILLQTTKERKKAVDGIRSQEMVVFG
jgi:hypothetical protein